MSDSKILDNQQKLDLAAMIKANDTEDCTEEIRSKKQSSLIRNDVKQMVFLKQKYERLAKSNPGEFDSMCVKQCNFLFNNYTDLYNKIKNDTLDLNILERFLNILKKIEDGELNQHEASYMVGKHLKELYIDSAMRNQQKMESRDRRKKIAKKPPGIGNVSEKEKNISYKDFKILNERK
tara:strand:+ start:2882 stop:3418 length:537 start_codon:yes stop_codon:yes gene_type:complete